MIIKKLTITITKMILITRISLLTTILSLTNYCQEVFRPRLKFPVWAMPTLIFSRVGACPPCSPRAGAHGSELIYFLAAVAGSENEFDFGPMQCIDGASECC